MKTHPQALLVAAAFRPAHSFQQCPAEAGLYERQLGFHTRSKMLRPKLGGAENKRVSTVPLTDWLGRIFDELSRAKGPKRQTLKPALTFSGERSRHAELTTRFENQLLYAPIQQFGDVEFGLRRARDFVDPTELLELFA